MGKFAGSTEILEAVDLLTYEKGFSQEILASILENAIGDVMKDIYGHDSEIVVKMTRQTGDIEAYRSMKVVDKVSDATKELSYLQAKRVDPFCSIGDDIKQFLPDFRSDRLIAGKIRDGILKAIRSCEKQSEYEEFKKKEGELIHGFVKKATKSHCIVAIGSRVEAFLPHDGMIFGETFHEKQKIVSCIQEVNRSDTDFQIVLSRSSDEFLSALLAEEVPEIKEGNVEIKAIARNPGSRAKVVVWSSDGKIDPVGACIGIRGSRVNAIVEELNKEKIDIILWDRDLRTFATNVIVPAKPTKVEIEKEFDGEEIIRIVVPSKDMNLAIGKRGQNVRLASKILGKSVEVISEEDRQAKVMAKLNYTTAELTKVLDIDEIVAQILISEGFMSVAQIAEARISSLSSINGFDEKIAEELSKRAKEYIEELDKKYEQRTVELGFDKSIENLPFMTKTEYNVLMDNKILTLQDVADLSSDELLDILTREKLSERNAIQIVMTARREIYGI